MGRRLRPENDNILLCCSWFYSLKARFLSAPGVRLAAIKPREPPVFPQQLPVRVRAQGAWPYLHFYVDAGDLNLSPLCLCNSAFTHGVSHQPSPSYFGDRHFLPGVWILYLDRPERPHNWNFLLTKHKVVCYVRKGYVHILLKNVRF